MNTQANAANNNNNNASSVNDDDSAWNAVLERLGLENPNQSAARQNSDRRSANGNESEISAEEEYGPIWRANEELMNEVEQWKKKCKEWEQKYFDLKQISCHECDEKEKERTESNPLHDLYENPRDLPPLQPFWA